MAEYLISLTASAILSSVVVSIAGKKGPMSAALKTLAGIFMTLTILSPWTEFRISNILDGWQDLQLQSDAVVAEGENTMRQEMETIIKEKIASYILDKAAFYGAELTVEVSVDGSELPVPCGVRISGSISPYGRKQMEQMIARDLGIALEDQIWQA